MKKLTKNNPTYTSWRQMKYRCNREKASNYKTYGAKGITYDPKWENFKEFEKDMGDRPEGLTLDRIDNKKGYTKNNCKWSTSKEQNRNTSFNRKITYNKETKCLSEWDEYFKYRKGTIAGRLNKGWSEIKALITPIKYKYFGKTIKWMGIKRSVSRWSELLEIKPNIINERLRRGWSIDRTLTTSRKNNQCAKVEGD